ncbi:MAG TPA: carbohydrate ABC transporter permease [Candidatus Limnocylindria bacterium]|nr:carbohydrate ABC transporter permease [Candidatus Limnocylindria bacterium]
MISAGFMGAHEVFAYPPRFAPETWRLDNIDEVFARQPFGRQFVNSVYIAALNVGGTIVVSSLAGYAFARIPFPGRTVVFVLFLSALLMPLEVLIIPLYILMKELGWLGTHVPLIVEPIFGAPAVVATFVMRQHFLSLPIELEDAARIDGLGRLGIFRHIALPLAKPALATIAILTFLASWNSFLEPLVFVAGVPELMTVPIGLTQYVEVYGEPIWNIQMAASSLSVVPILVVFVFAQRHFVRGISRAGIQG